MNNPQNKKYSSLTCEDFESAGLWITGYCCKDCHLRMLKNLDDGEPLITSEQEVELQANGTCPSFASVCCHAMAMSCVLTNQELIHAANIRDAKYNLIRTLFEMNP